MLFRIGEAWNERKRSRLIDLRKRSIKNKWRRWNNGKRGEKKDAWNEQAKKRECKNKDLASQMTDLRYKS